MIACSCRDPLFLFLLFTSLFNFLCAVVFFFLLVLLWIHEQSPSPPSLSLPLRPFFLSDPSRNTGYSRVHPLTLALSLRVIPESHSCHYVLLNDISSGDRILSGRSIANKPMIERRRTNMLWISVCVCDFSCFS